MESSESYTAAAESLEKLTIRSQKPESTEKPTHIRFLVSKALAGSLIGKGGSTITQFQENSGAQIHLSRIREYFPGTMSRIVVVSGTTKQVLTALRLVLGKLHSELQAKDGSGIELRRTRIVVPNSSCGGIIGKGGATIRSFIEESEAVIKISHLDHTFFGLKDRLVTLSGTMEEQMRAIALILPKLTEDDDYSQKVHSPNSYAGFYHAAFRGFKLVKHARGHLGSRENHKEYNIKSVTIGVSDEHIGVVLGRGGIRIKQLSLVSGARIKISGRGNFVPGTTDRKVTISGLQGSIDFAVWIIQSQVVWASERAKNKIDIEEEP